MLIFAIALTPPAIGKFALAVAGGTGLGIVAWRRLVLRPFEWFWERREYPRGKAVRR